MIWTGRPIVWLRRPAEEGKLGGDRRCHACGVRQRRRLSQTHATVLKLERYRFSGDETRRAGRGLRDDGSGSTGRCGDRDGFQPGPLAAEPRDAGDAVARARKPLRLLKVQTPALRLKRPRGGRDLWFGAHNFIAITDDAGRVLGELHGIARGPGGAQLRIYGGVLPFRREVIWGERFDHRTGFYDESFPQGVLAEGYDAVRCLKHEPAVRAAVNAREIAYPWPAAFGANSNAYYATLVAGMGLSDIRLDGQLWAPSDDRLLLDAATLAAI